MKTRVLIFDDDRDSVTLYTKILEEKGYEVVTRAQCLDCVEVVGFFNPSVIFMDHNMPGKSGLDAVALLKSNPEYRCIPIVYFSSSDELDKLAKSAGADGFLQKPCTIKTFEAAIQEALSASHC